MSKQLNKPMPGTPVLETPIKMAAKNPIVNVIGVNNSSIDIIASFFFTIARCLVFSYERDTT